MTETSKKIIKFVIVGCVICLSLGVFLSVFFYNDQLSRTRTQKYEKASQENIFLGDPKMLQNFFLDDVKNGVNDKYTKSSAFLIIDRYVTNGGNVYEIFDYIENNPELAFLKDAESIYPRIFSDVKMRNLQLVYSDRGAYVYLAYLEVLSRNNYESIAVMGTLIGQYSKLAYYKKMIVEEKIKGKAIGYPDYSKEEIENDTNKALFFIDKYRDQIIRTLSATSSLEEIDKRNILSGLVQYASGLRYLEAQGLNPTTLKEAQEVFAFVSAYSHHHLKGMYLFISLTNASTLLLLPLTTSNELRGAIYPFLTFDSKISKPNGIFAEIIGAKYQKHVSKFADLNVNSKVNIVNLGNRVPEFKSWLIYNGWDDNDFR